MNHHQHPATQLRFDAVVELSRAISAYLSSQRESRARHRLVAEQPASRPDSYYTFKLRVELLRRDTARSRNVFAAERRAREALAYSRQKTWLECVNSHIAPLLEEFEELQASEVAEPTLEDLLESGIGSHPEEMELETVLNLDPSRCKHRMVSRKELFTDWQRTSLYEQFCPTEAGPWHYTHVDEETGYVTELGYEGMANSSELLPEPWEALATSHAEEQNSLDQIERTVGRALIKHRVEARTAYFEKILAFVQTADIAKVRASKRRFWRWVLASRQACAAAGMWHEVCLTKSQVTDIFAAYDARLK